MELDEGVECLLMHEMECLHNNLLTSCAARREEAGMETWVYSLTR